MKSPATLAERKRSSTLLLGSMLHVAVRPLAYHATSQDAHGGAQTPDPGHNLSQVAARTESAACTATPMRCPFGGACHACPLPVQAKLAVNRPGDRHEQEADRVTEQVMRVPRTHLQRSTMGPPASIHAPSIVHEALRSPGQPLPPSTRALMEPRFGQDFGEVRVHTDARAAESARAVNALAYTVGHDIVFSTGKYAPRAMLGQHLLAHELAHVVQQSQASQHHLWRESVPAIQREAAQPAIEEKQLTGPLTDREWQLLENWQSRGEVGIDPLTDNPDHNALVVADAIFCGRFLGSPGFNSTREDPLLCVISEVTRVDPRVQQIARHVTARGPIINWARVDPNQRMLHVMELLVNVHGYPENGAAGLVGNLRSESGVLPNRVEGSSQDTPMRARNFAGRLTEFTAEQMMNRDPAAQQGPRRPGVGLAQWTSTNRRAGLFQHTFQGRQLGAGILFSMDAQVDYLVTELQSDYPHVNNVLRGAGVSLNAASDEVVYRFEVPGAVLDSAGHLLPRAHPAVQAVFARRRANSRRALRVYREAHP